MILAVILAAGLVLAAGCQDEENPVLVTPDPIVEPRTPEALLSQFRAAYETQDKTDYLSLLDPDFQFILQPETTARFPELGPSLDYDEEERIHLRMFSGESVVDPLGNLHPAVQTIVFHTFEAVDSWTDTDDPLRFPDARWAPFDVVLLFDRGQVYSALQATGQVKIYVREITRAEGTEEITYFKLAGMVDLTRSDKGVEATPWGLIKAFYR